jgi:hypothetical protein
VLRAGFTEKPVSASGPAGQRLVTTLTDAYPLRDIPQAARLSFTARGSSIMIDVMAPKPVSRAKVDPDDDAFGEIENRLKEH